METIVNTRATPMMDKANDVKRDLADLGHLAVDAAKQKASQVKDDAMDMYAQGCAEAKNVQTQAEEFIKQEPLKAVLIAGAVGVALGWLLSQRFSK